MSKIWDVLKLTKKASLSGCNFLGFGVFLVVVGCFVLFLRVFFYYKQQLRI